jgi:hypothetical protein
MTMKKKKFHVYGKMTASKYLGTFEATSKKKAIEAALNSEANFLNICHQCNGEIDLADSIFEEADAEIDEEERA